MKLFKLYNKYDKFEFLLIASLAFGILGGSFQVIRILGIILAPFFLNKIGSLINTDRKVFNAIILFLFYCVISLIWTPDTSEGFKELLYFTIHFLIFFEIICFSKYANKPLASISLGWVIAVCGTLTIAAWEIYTGNHLSLAKFEEAKQMNTVEGIMLRYFVTATFFNLNTYVTFLCFATPFLFYKLSTQTKVVNKLVLLLIIAFSFWCVLFNASRGGLLSLLVMTGVYMATNIKSKSGRIWIYLPMLVLLFLSLSNLEDVFTVLFIRSSDGMLLEGGDRWVIWGNALHAFFPTYGFGVGVGGMGLAMSQYKNGTDITITHNMFLEILLQYGIVFLVLFVVFLIRMFVCAKKRDFETKQMLYIALIAFPIYSIINSGYLLNPFVYVAFSSLYVFSRYEHVKFSN